MIKLICCTKNGVFGGGVYVKEDSNVTIIIIDTVYKRCVHLERHTTFFLVVKKKHNTTYPNYDKGSSSRVATVCDHVISRGVKLLA